MGIFQDLLGAGNRLADSGHDDPNTPEYSRAIPAPEPRTVPEPFTIHGPGAVIPKDDYAPRFMAATLRQTDNRRPCWARGRKAMFHRWVESAHPVPPRNIQAARIDEKTRYFQYSSTQALVEFEDGTCARVWPNEVQFADDGGFDEYDWRPMTEGGQEDGAE